MIFDFNLKDFEFIKKRFLMNEIDNIVDEIKRIITYVKKNAIQANKIMIAQVNKHRKSIEYEINNYVWLDRRNIKIVRLSNKLNHKYLEFYSITKKRNQVYELELLETMQIHSIFHFWLLRKNSQNSLSKQQNEFSKSIRLNENSEWQIDNIVDSRYHYHRLQYRVNWTSYFHDRQWYYVDDDQFINAQNVIDEYHRLNSRIAKFAFRDD